MNGIDCVFEGLRLIRQPGLRRYVVIPLVLNVCIFIAVIVWGFLQFDAWVTAMMESLPDWLSFLSWLMWPLAVLVALLFLFYGFTVIANIIAAPFNSVLSTRVEERLAGKAEDVPEIAWFKVFPRAIAREFSKLFYILPRFLGLLLLMFIPVLQVAAPFLLLLFSAWMMAVEYTDYAADNNGLEFKPFRQRLQAVRLQALMFGLLIYGLMAIPLINLVIMPAAVAGGTKFWVEHLRRPARDG
ncbi:MAG: sulfate transporter CysZ [Pseudomonadales bacterium]|nr:sulfate transporter CysZ [Pseudomonadales bacterium]